MNIKNANHRRVTRWFGYAVVTCVWGTLGTVVAFFVVTYAMYLDLTGPTRHHLTAGTGAEFVLGAVYDRFRSPSETQRDPVLAYVPKAGRGRIQSPEYDSTFTISPDQMRAQPDAASQNAPILMIGDSFTFGLGVSDDQTFSALLEQRYHHHTINTGVIGYGTARELLRLHRLGRLATASMLVIQFCSNDGRENHDFIEHPQASFATDEPTESWRIVGTSRYLQPTYLNVIKATVQYLTYRFRVEGVRRSLLAVWRSERTPFGQPTHVRDNRSGSALAGDFLSVLDRFPEVSHTPILVTELNDRGSTTGFLPALRKLTAARSNISVVPLQLEESDFYRFDGHLTPQGHERVATQLDKAIIARLNVGRRSQQAGSLVPAASAQ